MNQQTMRSWVLGGPGEMSLSSKPMPRPQAAEVLVRIDAIAICATDLEVIDHGMVAIVNGGSPFNVNFTPGHEYMGTVIECGPGADDVKPGQRVAVEVHAGCRQCPRCREGMYTSCLNYGYPNKGHRANGFTTDGGFAEYAVNHISTLVPIPDHISDEEATLIVTAGTAIYGLDTLGGLVAGQTFVVTGGGAIGLMAVAVAKLLGAAPVILTDIAPDRLAMGRAMGADHVVNAGDEDPVAAVLVLNGGRGVEYVMECSGTPHGFNDALNMVNRGGRVCLAAFSGQPSEVNAARIVGENITVFGIRGEGKSAVKRAAALFADGRIDAKALHTHTFGFDQVPQALDHARNKTDGAIKVVVKIRGE